ncbi:MAG: hypothetical protein ACRD32_06640 [Nitrososphaerales archaeon]
MDRNKKAEENLINKSRLWLEKDSKDRTGIHASDLLDPRKAYYDKVNPQPLSNRMVGLFFVGKVLHAFFLSALTGETGVNWKSDGGSTIDKELGFSYSPDWCKDGIPGELKTSRSKYEQSKSDLGGYLEQLLIYMVGKKSEEGRLVVLLLSLPAPRGEGWGTYPQYRAYNVHISKADLAKYKSQLIATRKLLVQALKTNKRSDIAKLPLCRTYKCGRSQCPHYDVCKPETRYGTHKFDK